MGQLRKVCKRCGIKITGRKNYCSKSCYNKTYWALHPIPSSTDWYYKRYPNAIPHKDPRREERRKQIAASKEQAKLERIRKRVVRELARLNTKLLKMVFQPQQCKCGQIFETVNVSRKYCADCTHARAYKSGDIRARCRKYNLSYDSKVTLNAVRMRDSDVCQICQTPIEWQGRHSKRPTVDHIIPLSASYSPGHVWDNVQLAHRGCNSRKKDKILVKTA